MKTASTDFGCSTEQSLTEETFAVFSSYCATTVAFIFLMLQVGVVNVTRVGKVVSQLCFRHPRLRLGQIGEITAFDRYLNRFLRKA